MLALLTAITALVAVAPLWLRAGRRAAPRAAAVVLSALALGVAAAALLRDDPGGAPPASRPLELPAGGYVGSARCRSCHPEEHASWHASFHRTMTQVASRDALRATFERLELDWSGKPVLLEWRGARLWVEFERGGARPGPVQRPVEQVTGSHHLQVLWYSTGRERELAPVPMAYRIDEAIWLPLPAVFVVPPELRDPPEPGAWNQNCHMCHATGVRPRLDVDRCDTHAAELGIACEACHGPGAQHVAVNADPLRRYALHLGEGGDPTIVDPHDLDAARSAQVCGQCHSVSIERIEFFDTWREDGLRFRPGQDLAATRRVLDPSQSDAPEVQRRLRTDPHYFANVFWSDGSVRVSGREYNGLVQSPCYAHGAGERRMTCLSCHRMHRPRDVAIDDWRDDQLGPGMRGNEACTQCHERFRSPAALAAHTRHGPESAGSRCYDCHMSYTTFGLMKAMRSHTIGSPSVQAELETGRPNACNQCHLDRTLQWTAEHLHAWYGTVLPALDDEQREVAASVRWLLTGDAGQRALAAWSMGWDEARAASGTDWLQPYLSQLLADPYYAVRFVARRSLRSLPGANTAALLGGYDFLGDAAAGRAAADALQQAWRAAYSGSPRPALLLDGQGLRQDAFLRLYARRDDRPVFLAE
jgi:hypothetical protein